MHFVKVNIDKLNLDFDGQMLFLNLLYTTIFIHYKWFIIFILKLQVRRGAVRA